MIETEGDDGREAVDDAVAAETPGVGGSGSSRRRRPTPPMVEERDRGSAPPTAASRPPEPCPLPELPSRTAGARAKRPRPRFPRRPRPRQGPRHRPRRGRRPKATASATPISTPISAMAARRAIAPAHASRARDESDQGRSACAAASPRTWRRRSAASALHLCRGNATSPRSRRCAPISTTIAAQRPKLTLLPAADRRDLPGAAAVPDAQRALRRRGRAWSRRHGRGPSRHGDADRCRADGPGDPRRAGPERSGSSRAEIAAASPKPRAPARPRSRSCRARRSRSPRSARSAASPPTPVINRPEVAIIGPNKIVERPIFVPTGDDDRPRAS